MPGPPTGNSNKQTGTTSTQAAASAQSSNAGSQKSGAANSPGTASNPGAKGPSNPGGSDAGVGSQPASSSSKATSPSPSQPKATSPSAPQSNAGIKGGKPASPANKTSPSTANNNGPNKGLQQSPGAKVQAPTSAPGKGDLPGTGVAPNKQNLPQQTNKGTPQGVPLKGDLPNPANRSIAPKGNQTQTKSATAVEKEIAAAPAKSPQTPVAGKGSLAPAVAAKVQTPDVGSILDAYAASSPDARYQNVRDQVRTVPSAFGPPTYGSTPPNAGWVTNPRPAPTTTAGKADLPAQPGTIQRSIESLKSAVDDLYGKVTTGVGMFADDVTGVGRSLLDGMKSQPAAPSVADELANAFAVTPGDMTRAVTGFGGITQPGFMREAYDAGMPNEVLSSPAAANFAEGLPGAGIGVAPKDQARLGQGIDTPSGVLGVDPDMAASLGSATLGEGYADLANRLAAGEDMGGFKMDPSGIHDFIGERPPTQFPDVPDVPRSLDVQPAPAAPTPQSTSIFAQPTIESVLSTIRTLLQPNPAPAVVAPGKGGPDLDGFDEGQYAGLEDATADVADGPPVNLIDEADYVATGKPVNLTPQNWLDRYLADKLGYFSQGINADRNRPADPNTRGYERMYPNGRLPLSAGQRRTAIAKADEAYLSGQINEQQLALVYQTFAA